MPVILPRQLNYIDIDPTTWFTETMIDLKKARRVMRMKNLRYCGDDDQMETLLNFEAGLRRTVAERIALGFGSARRPGIDEPGIRLFKTMSEYRSWCEKNTPRWLGYAR